MKRHKATIRRTTALNLDTVWPFWQISDQWVYSIEIDGSELKEQNLYSVLSNALVSELDRFQYFLSISQFAPVKGEIFTAFHAPSQFSISSLFTRVHGVSDPADATDILLEEHSAEYKAVCQKINQALAPPNFTLARDELSSVIGELNKMPDSFIKYLFQVVCYYLLDMDILGPLASIKSHYPQFYSSQLVCNLLTVVNHSGVSKLKETRSIVVFSPVNSTERIVMNTVYTTMLSMTSSNYKIDKLDSTCSITKEEFLIALSKQNADNLLFLGSGSANSGYKVYLKNSQGPDDYESLAQNELEAIMKTNQQREFGVSFFSCNGQYYSPVRVSVRKPRYLLYNFLSNNPAAELFAFGFSKSYARFQEFRIASITGKLSLTMRGIKEDDCQLARIDIRAGCLFY